MKDKNKDKFITLPILYFTSHWLTKIIVQHNSNLFYTVFLFKHFANFIDSWRFYHEDLN